MRTKVRPRGFLGAKGRSIFEKAELIEAIAQRADVPKSQAQKYFDAFEQVVTDTLKGGDEVQITGFGKFYVRGQKARDGRNPQTGEKMRIPAQKVLRTGCGHARSDARREGRLDKVVGLRDREAHLALAR